MPLPVSSTISCGSTGMIKPKPIESISTVMKMKTTARRPEAGPGKDCSPLLAHILICASVGSRREPDDLLTPREELHQHGDSGCAHREVTDASGQDSGHCGESRLSGSAECVCQDEARVDAGQEHGPGHEHEEAADVDRLIHPPFFDRSSVSAMSVSL